MPAPLPSGTRPLLCRVHGFFPWGLPVSPLIGGDGSGEDRMSSFAHRAILAWPLPTHTSQPLMTCPHSRLLQPPRDAETLLSLPKTPGLPTKCLSPSPGPPNSTAPPNSISLPRPLVCYFSSPSSLRPHQDSPQPRFRDPANSPGSQDPQKSPSPISGSPRSPWDPSAWP